MLQADPDLSFEELIQKYLGPAIVAFFVFVLPAIRAAATAKKEREEQKRRTLERGSAPEDTAPSGRKAWEDLLQGRGAAPPPLPPQSVEPDVEEEESLEDNPPPPLVGLPSASAVEPEPESAAEEFIAARERQEAERQEQTAAAEYVASSPYRPGVAPEPASAVPVVTEAVRSAPSPAERWLFPKEPARDRRAAIRRAIVLREVLGPPIGLR